MAEFVLNVQDIDEVGKDYAFPIRASWLASALDATGVGGDATEGTFELRANKQGRDILVRGRLRAGLVTECARCLGDAHIAVDADVTSLLTARGEDVRPSADDVDLTPEELDREFYSGDTVVLDAVVREHLLLEVPIQPLCAEDCAGIPVPASVAGPADLRAETSEGAVDPRLAPLLKLVGKLDPTKE